MNIKNIAMAAKSSLKKNSPEILLGAGIVGMVAGAVCACTETPKAIEVIEEAKETRVKVEEVHNNPDQYPEYTEKDYKKDKLLCYIQPAGKLLKVYSPAIIIGSLSIASLLTSHNLMRKRLIGVAAAYAALDKTFKEYRQRVVDKYGEEEDYRLRYNVVETGEKIKIMDKNGKSKNVKLLGPNIDNGMSCYARLYDEENVPTEFNRLNYDLNVSKIEATKRYFNDKLRIQKRVFLCDLLYALGYDENYDPDIYDEYWDMAHHVGWTYDPKRDDIDNYIEIKILNFNPEIDGDMRDPAFWIDFNVQGVVL